MRRVMGRAINIGIVGMGRAGAGMILRELEAHPKRFRLTAVCDIDPARCEEAVRRFGCRAFTDAANLFADADTELVAIATRTLDHFDHARDALRAGKHVFLEKPMCATLAEARSLKRIAARSEGGLFIRHSRRFDPDFEHVREIIESGILGEVYEAKLHRHSFARRDDWQTLRKHGGGQLMNWGPHLIDQSLIFLDAPLRSQWSDLKCVRAAGDADDFVRILMKGRNGRIVDVEINGGAAQAQPLFVVFGNRGSLQCDREQIQLKYLDPRKKLAPRKSSPGTPPLGQFGTPETLPWIEKTIPIRPAWKGRPSSIWVALFDAIRNGRDFPITMDQALAVMKVISDARAGTAFDVR